MAKKSVIQRNLKRIQICDRYRSRRQELKGIISNKSIPVHQRFIAQLKLSKMPRDSSAVRIRNRCLLSGRGRGVYMEFGLSRIALRKLCPFGYIPGMLKSSW
ncbi:MAG: 30S ribosomal protein S14 [Candidatus Mesenet longicola]|uniref:Small ribosomal subunit protein uS14 n=1 Tax=Candidatus Mesenet longicola TaxID=1892558 RepID=A0A8J3MNP2_9RICK|nr:MAG: 30S ribosomal protein S14 [Candidatus Mesenet longicola]GHM59163.1 MAG: 30S ribosomal protein S14 [Candidatus Mesenet longicola]